MALLSRQPPLLSRQPRGRLLIHQASGWLDLEANRKGEAHYLVVEACTAAMRTCMDRQAQGCLHCGSMLCSVVCARASKPAPHKVAHANNMHARVCTPIPTPTPCPCTQQGRRMGAVPRQNLPCLARLALRSPGSGYSGPSPCRGRQQSPRRKPCSGGTCLARIPVRQEQMRAVMRCNARGWQRRRCAGQELCAVMPADGSARCVLARKGYVRAVMP